MALRKALLIAAASMAVVVGGLLPATAFPNNHVVGDLDGWDVGVNYNTWARGNDHIPAGDTLSFMYDPVFHNVVQVWDQNSYDNCITPNQGVSNGLSTMRSGSDIVQLGEPGTYFFFCEFDCTRGMKLAITAV